MDFGTRGSMGRNVAFFHAKGDRDGVAAVASTATAILCGVAGVVLAATFATAHWLPDLFDIPPRDADAARWAFLLVGATVVVNLALGVFDGLLWGLQHFGVINRIEIAADVVRAGATFWLIGAGHGLVALAAVTLLVAAATQLAKMVCCVWLTGGLLLSPRLVGRETARLIFGYGVWTFMLALGKMVTEQSGPLIIGARLGVALVTPYSIAVSLVRYANMVSVRTAEVFIPVAATLHAQEDRHRQQRLLLGGGRYSLILAVFYLPAFLLLGRPFIALWVGPGYELSALLLAVIILGEVLPISQHFSRAVLLGMGRPRVVALINVAENVVTIAAALVVARPFGLIGIVVTYAVCGALGRGLVQVVLVCRVAHIPLRAYLTGAVLPALGVAAPAAAVLGLLVAWRVPGTWAELVTDAAVYGVCYLLAAGALLLGPRRMVARGTAILRRLRGASR